MKSTALLLLALALAVPGAGFADGPKDNLPNSVRPIPPIGVEVPPADREAIEKGLKELRQAIDEAKRAQAKHPRLADLLPDVEIFYKSVDWALRYQLFSKPPEIKLAFEQLAEGRNRAAALLKGDAPWTRQKGLVVRAYRSRIDGSIQPYGLVIPESYDINGGAPVRLDFWIHGRGETLSELSFVDQRMKQKGQVLPANAIVLHPYGRYCCANKFAGEVDLFEALEHAKKFYRIDDDRIVMRGFSMGGAAAWQFATHFADQWCAANPGAGFAETAEFLKVFQTEDVNTVPWWHKKLWGWYDATDYALNLIHCPTVAYSGELDKQKQAADIMARFLKEEGIALTHLIGPQTAHKIHPDSLVEIEKRLEAITAMGRDRTPAEVHFVTKTLRYHRLHWVTVNGLKAHWEKGRVDARITGPASVEVKTSGITALTLDFAAGHSPFDLRRPVEVTLDGTKVTLGTTKSDRSFQASFHQKGGKWLAGPLPKEAGLRKEHGLTGPVDDAFMDAFLFVTPSGPALNPAVEKWVGSELPRAVREWQKQFRGDVPQKKDAEVNDADIAANHLVLWGDPSSNAVLKKLADRLPVKWTASGIIANGKTYAAGEHVPILIYPNPLNPARYVVINSGFTYREYDYLNNARQVPKLPDWAVVNLSEAPNAVTPGKIVEAGFFDESWQLQSAPASP